MGHEFCQEQCCSALDSITADLYEEQTFTAVIAMSQSCCQVVLQRSTEQWRVHSAKIRCCSALDSITADLYEEQTFTTVIALS